MLRALIVLLMAIGHFIAGNFQRITNIGLPIDVAVNPGAPPQEQPSGWAFAIWGLIFTLALLYAIRQALPAHRDTALYQAIGWPAALAFATNNAWMMQAQLNGNGLPLVLLIFTILIFTTTAFFRTLAMRPRLDTFDRTITLPLFAIFSGWLSAAVWVNLTAYLRLIKAIPATLSPQLTTAVAMVAIAALSLLILRRANGYLWYGLTTLWALAGIAHANVTRFQNKEIASLAVGLGLIVVAVLLWRRRPAAQHEIT
jgi:hypothetical protein